MRIKSEDFGDTVRHLAHLAGVSLTESAVDRRKNDYYSINELIAGHYHRLLFSDAEGRKAFKYLTAERGLSTQTINDYMLGYAPNGWDTAVSFLNANRIPLALAYDVGLVMKKQSGKDYYDRFRGRIMFPIKDHKSRIIAFGGRRFDGEEPKYLNSPDSDVYRKGTSLYGIDIARSHADSTGCFLFVEGYMDAIVMHQNGFKNTVATTGTAVSLYHANIASRFARDAVFLFDGDEAGEKAGLRTLEVIIESDIEGRMALLPPGYDPDTLLIKYGKKAMDEIINDAAPLFEYFVKKTIAGTHGTVAEKLRAIRSILVLLRRVEHSPIKQELYIQKLAELTGVSEPSIRNGLRQAGTPRYERAPVKTVRADDAVQAPSQAEIVLLSIIIDHPEKMHNLFSDGIIGLLTNTDIVASIQYVKTLYESGAKDIKGTLFQRDLDDGLKAVLSAALLNDLSEEDVHALYEYAVTKIKKAYYINEQRRLSREIAKTRTAEDRGSYNPLVDALLKKKREIVVSHKK
ncbi:MAG: toprim domain-containing protein [Deltaproteobacteria bacterium]|nr:toprim domain-containing protein [Deltaproteobacteria bacterium]